MSPTTRNALEAALHALVTQQGLLATDRPDAYAEALREGCDADAAYDAQREVSWVINDSDVIKTIKSALEDSDA